MAKPQKSRKPERIAACVDIGTNSVLLSVARPTRRGWIKEIDYDQKTTQLGKESQIGNMLKPEPMQATRRAVREMVVRARNQKAEAVYLIGTQALRKARNAADFVAMVRRDTGQDINVISGMEESRLSFLAVDKSLPRFRNKSVADIGGGSTEIIQALHGKMGPAVSLPLGCVTLTEQFIYPAELLEMRKHVREYLKSELGSISKANGTLVGVGGTVTTLAAVQLELEQYDAAEVQGHTLTTGWIERFSQRFARMSQKEKLTLSCASPERLGVLGAGMEILLGIMAILGKKSVVVSDFGLRHAVLWEHFQRK